ncbi:MAG: hypothetical protein SPI35_00025 [Porphyromonas sp.]|nr:hypothetical protein [Porphyromonas sp.]
MKKVLISFAVLLSVVLTTHVANAQTSSWGWKVSLGMGVSGSESMTLGFARGVQISYDVDIFEFGLSLHHASSQTLSTTKRHGLGFHLNGQDASIQISQGSKDSRIEHSSANTSSINLFAGVDILKALKVKSRHSLILGALGGIGLHDSSFIINNAEGKTIDVRYGELWSYGAKASYEYMITERVGAGFSATYDFPQQNFCGLANLIVLF